jgi:hypothetical protein
MIRMTAWAMGVLFALSAAPGEASRGSAPSPRCPAKVAAAKPTNNPAGSSALVPSRPTRLVLCRYTGLNDQPPMALAYSVRIKRAGRVRDLGRKLDTLPERPDGTSACPSGDGSAIAARFSYKKAAPVTVVVQLGGCGDVTNGRVHRTSMGAESLVERLKALTGCQPGEFPYVCKP